MLIKVTSSIHPLTYTPKSLEYLGVPMNPYVYATDSKQSFVPSEIELDKYAVSFENLNCRR